MKRTSLKRGTSQLKRSGFKQKAPVKKARKRKDPESISVLKKKLWTKFSLFVRERDNYTCFTCGKQATGSGMHAGHFITGATCPVSLYFDETNVHAQCYHCNINLSGNWVIYEERMRAKYGNEIVDQLKLKRTLLMGEKKDSEWYKQLIHSYVS